MLENLSKAITEAAIFVKQHQIDAEFHLHKVSELNEHSEQQSSYWKKFEKKAGVYCIFGHSGELTKYIGMSQTCTGGRVFKWVYLANKINDELEPDDVILSIVIEKQAYMAPALESFLIARLSPVFNSRK